MMAALLADDLSAAATGAEIVMKVYLKFLIREIKLIMVEVVST